MLGAHHGNGVHHKRVATGLEHREQHGFFLVHVRGQLLLQGLQKIAQPSGHTRPATVHGLDPVRHADQLWKLGPVHVVVAADDVVNQCAGLGSGRGGIGALQCLQLGQQGLWCQTFGLRRISQAQVPATAKVQVQAPEHGSGAGQFCRQLANGLGGVQALGSHKRIGKWSIHQVILKGSFMMNILLNKILFKT